MNKREYERKYECHYCIIMTFISDIKNLSYQSKAKEFYIKFIYLPRLNNIQYILKYYKDDTYKYIDFNEYDYSDYSEVRGEIGYIYYYRDYNKKYSHLNR